jgi:hypothetical protein
VNTDQLAPDEPLSPELVLVFSPELRAQAIAGLPPPAWAKRRPRTVATVAPEPEPQPFVPSFGAILFSRVAQLAAIFVFVTIIVLGLSLVANAMR